MMNWVFDASRTEGETGTVNTDSNIYFVLFHSRARQDYQVVNARHILFEADTSALDSTSETYEADVADIKESAHNDAEKALKEWQDGGATAELFAQMAGELSGDAGSASNGGLYEGISKTTNFIPEFLDWCFADGRKVGDAGVIDTSYGSHVMYLDSFGDPYWKVQATNTLKNDVHGVAGRERHHGRRDRGLRHAVRRLLRESPTTIAKDRRRPILCRLYYM